MAPTFIRMANLWRKRQLQVSKNVTYKADAKTTQSYFLGPTYLSPRMSFLVRKNVFEK